MEKDIVSSDPGTYVLTGGVGSGKTTFLRRFVMIDRGFVKNYCIWVHIDFLPIGNVEESKIDSEVRRFVYQAIRKELTRAYASNIPHSGSEIRQLFSEELERAERTRLGDTEAEGQVRPAQRPRGHSVSSVSARSHCSST